MMDDPTCKDFSRKLLPHAKLFGQLLLSLSLLKESGFPFSVTIVKSWIRENGFTQY
jgi:hypothetical protein